ncbi:MAG: hypothetical protein GY859_08095 [Desulfobacterales bacterium]|nr:hypothetical protein [Desulfobacterales bacterium]
MLINQYVPMHPRIFFTPACVHAIRFHSFPATAGGEPSIPDLEFLPSRVAARAFILRPAFIQGEENARAFIQGEENARAFSFERPPRLAGSGIFPVRGDEN